MDHQLKSPSRVIEDSRTLMDDRRPDALSGTTEMLSTEQCEGRGMKGAYGGETYKERC